MSALELGTPAIIILAVLSSTVLAAVVAYFGTRATLKANKPVNAAQADLFRAQAVQALSDANSDTIERLTGENARLSARVTALEAGRAADHAEIEVLTARERILVENLVQFSSWAKAERAAPGSGGTPPEFYRIDQGKAIT